MIQQGLAICFKNIVLEIEANGGFWLVKKLDCIFSYVIFRLVN